MSENEIKKTYEDIEAQLYFISQNRSALCSRLNGRPITLQKVIRFYTNLEKLSFIDSSIVNVPEDIKIRTMSEEQKLLRDLISLEKGVKISYRKLSKLKRDGKVILE